MIETALYMIPVGMSDARPDCVVPPVNIEICRELRYFIVENVRTARRWLRRCDPGFSFDGVTFFELNRHTERKEIFSMLEPLRQGNPMGVMSEAGCPGVADPGAEAVAIARKEGLRVVPLVGPSSILMSLMASGFNGQSFCFNGYLPIDDTERREALKRLEAESNSYGRTQIFIETPYRNNKMLEAVCEVLRPETRLCVACCITDPEHESIKTMSIDEWRHERSNYNKLPVIFLFQARENANGNVNFNKDRRKRR